MQARQRYIALACLLTFGIGSVVAPASHFVYMAISDAYGVMGHTMPTSHHADHPHQHGHHTTMLHEGAALLAPPEHEGCQYADLFATLLLSTTPEQASVAPIEQPTSLLHTWISATPAPSIYNLSARGPPMA